MELDNTRWPAVHRIARWNFNCGGDFVSPQAADRTSDFADSTMRRRRGEQGEWRAALCSAAHTQFAKNFHHSPSGLTNLELLINSKCDPFRNRTVNKPLYREVCSDYNQNNSPRKAKWIVHPEPPCWWRESMRWTSLLVSDRLSSGY